MHTHTHTRTLFGVDLSKPVVAHLVHETVEEDGGALLVHPELTLGSEVVLLMDMFPLLCAASNANHPQELVDV